MRNYSRFIPGEEIEEVEQWRFGAIDTASQLLAAQAKAREDAELQATQAMSRQESFEAGVTEGIEQGRVLAQAELQQQMADFLANQARETASHMGELVAAMQGELAQAQQVMAQGVLDLSCELARQVVRQELSVNTNVLLPVIREALDLLGAEHRSVVLKIHPTDGPAMEDLLKGELMDLGLTLRLDSTLAPGGCQLESAGMVVDATLQKRWQRAVATLGLSNAWEEPSEPR